MVSKSSPGPASVKISMADLVRRGFLQVSKTAYLLARPLIFTQSAQQTHDTALRLLRLLDNSPAMYMILRKLNKLAFVSHPVSIGGVDLPYPLILAAGFVKGAGFESEQDALTAVYHGENIIPGWHAMPALVGPIEFGSFTRWPRMGNPGVVVWRHVSTRSTQNRVGLKNPGAVAAAAFLSLHINSLPPIFGINIATTPGSADLERERQDILESLTAFMTRQVNPAWFTLNLSCPNTDDDPHGNQTEEKALVLCGAAVEYLRSTAPEEGREIPLWVKVGPDLSVEQYAALMRAFQNTGVRAVIATNTLPCPAPDSSGSVAGVGGGSLHNQAVKVAALLAQKAHHHHYDVDIIGCGGVQNQATYHAFAQLGIDVVQYWTALIYRGPLVAAFILNESQD
jgi:dihydroorotate dehydrogenase